VQRSSGRGRAASLDAVRAVSTFNHGREPSAPLTTDVVPQVYGLQPRKTCNLGDGDAAYLEQEEWILESAVSVARAGASARVVHVNAAVYASAGAASELLGPILSRCPNVISMRLEMDITRPEMVSLPATELGALAPNLEVLNLRSAHMWRPFETLDSVLAALPHLRVLLLGHIYSHMSVIELYFAGMAGRGSS
jgi:hypothetical protein